MSPNNSTTLPWAKNKPSIVVLGDIILDEYLDGYVNRISPEAPVPIHLVKSINHTAGGAGNAARNASLAGGNVYLAGVWGNDQASESLRKILVEDQVDFSAIVNDPKRPTTKKTRITSGNQQIIRVDWEKTSEISEAIQKKILERLTSLSFDAILISDYGKGALPQKFLKSVISLANERKKPVIVDPKGVDYNRYRGATLITPNYSESCLALGLDSSEEHDGFELGRSLRDRFELNNVLVTMGAKGMMLTPSDESKSDRFIHKQTVAREVFDVSGAGDTVAALITLALASHIDWDVSLELASLGAGIVVEKWGTQPITKEEMETALESQSHSTLPSHQKITTASQLVQTLQTPRYKDKKVVFTNGCFDLLHAGHVSYLEKARAKGDLLVLGINTDESIKRLKGPTRPIVDLSNRMTVLSGLSSIDFIVPFEDDTPLSLIEKVKPDVLIKGADYKITEIVGAEVVQENGGEVVTIALIDGLSSSEIIRRAQRIEQ